MTEWRAIPGADGYEASDDGQVRSWKRYGTRPKPHLLVQSTDRKGYKRVTIGRGYGRVHRLVLLAFVGEPPAGKPWGLHADDDPANNRLTNLRWGSRSENIRDSVRLGSHNAARVTQCPKGHEYTPENTRLVHGARNCRQCHRDDQRRRAHAKRVG